MTEGSGWMEQALAVLHKDIVAEFRTRHAVNSLIMFGVTTLVAVSFAMGPFGLSSHVLAALLWIILFFSAMAGLSRSFVKEEETGTIMALKSSADPTMVLLGKMMFNLILLAALEIVIVPLFFVMMDTWPSAPTRFFAVLLLGSLGLSAVSTAVAAIVSKAGSKGALFSVLAFPVLLPLLLSSISGTASALEGASPVWPELRLIVGYSGILITASFMLFEYIWEQ
ncbi:MAG: heme exporter protein CcmB [Bacillota bacterium]